MSNDMRRLKRLHFYFSLFLVNHVFVGTHFFGLKRALMNSCYNIKIGDNSKIVGPISLYGTLDVGKNVWIGRNFSIEGNGHVLIEDNCDIAPNVILYTGTHHVGDENRRAGMGVNGEVVIKRGSWICGSSIILPNVVVGSGTVIGAGSVVNKDTEGNVLVAGNPVILKKHLK